MNHLKTTRSAQSGFTLLEILIAMALTTVLLGSIYGSLDLYWRSQDTGREEMQRSQLARAILKQIAQDLRSVVFMPPDEEEAESADEDADAEDPDAETTSEPIQVDSTTAMAVNDLAFYGDTQTLILQVSRPARDMNYAVSIAEAGAGNRVSDLQKVSYFLADPQAGGLQAEVASRYAAEAAAMLSYTESRAAAGSIQGLARLEQDKFLVDMADDSGDLTSLAAMTQLMASEVSYLQFAYLDGQDVYETWDTETYGRLPAAVEIVIGFREEAKGSLETLAGYGAVPVKTYRLVVALPTAQPYVVEEDI